MKKVWKWIIGIAVVLVIVGALVGVSLLLRNHYLTMNSISWAIRPNVQVPGDEWELRAGPGRFPGMMPFGRDGWGGHGVYMRGPGMMGFSRMGIFGGLISGLFRLGFLALIVLGIVWLVKSLRPSKPPVALPACGKCGQPLQADWTNCPYCGNKR